MKRLYATLALLSAFTVGAYAQNVDLEAFSTIAEDTKLCPGKIFTPTEIATGDSIHGIWGVLFNGPDDLVEGDQMPFMTSFHKFLTQAEAQAEGVPFEDKYFWLSVATLNQANVDNGGLFTSYGVTDSIGLLVDWELFKQYGPDSFKMYGPPHDQFVDGKAYGFFVRVWGIGASTSAIVSTDPDPRNNWSVVKVIWRGCGTSISDMIADRKSVNITVFPNPAKANLSVKYNFAANENVRLIVRDITGKVVLNENQGHVKAGERQFDLNIGNLTSGMYTVELSGGEIRGVAKFTVK